MPLDYLGFRERGHRGEPDRRRLKNGLDMYEMLDETPVYAAAIVFTP
jgi:hypothetical protein